MAVRASFPVAGVAAPKLLSSLWVAAVRSRGNQGAACIFPYLQVPLGLIDGPEFIFSSVYRTSLTGCLYSFLL